MPDREPARITATVENDCIVIKTEGITAFELLRERPDYGRAKVDLPRTRVGEDGFGDAQAGF